MRNMSPVCNVLSLVGAMVIAVGAVVGVSAEDWPQWRGADRLAVWNETGIVEELPEELRVAWRTPIRSGYSGPAVADGRIFITDWMEDPESRTLDGTERALALDEQTGEVLWTHVWRTSYRMLSVAYAVGPRATPTVDGDRVYVVGGTGRLFCFDVETGRVLWEKDYVAEYDTSVPVWGIVSAPLVDRRPAHHGRGRRARRARRRLRQAHRRGDLARDRDRYRDGLCPAGHLRGGRRPATDRLASAGARVARSGDRRALLGAAVGRLHGRHRRHPRAERRLPAGLAVLQRLDDDAAQPGPARRDPSLAGPEPQRAAGRHRHHPRHGDDADHHRRLRLRGRQLRRAPCARRADRRAPLDEPGHDRAGALGPPRSWCATRTATSSTTTTAS